MSSATGMFPFLNISFAADLRYCIFGLLFVGCLVSCKALGVRLDFAFVVCGIPGGFILGSIFGLAFAVAKI